MNKYTIALLYGCIALLGAYIWIPVEQPVVKAICASDWVMNESALHKALPKHHHNKLVIVREASL